MNNSVIIACTVNKPLARLIEFETVGEGHMAIIENYGKNDEYWVDSRVSGVRVRAPEKDLHSAYYLSLPWQLDAANSPFIGRPYNFRGVFAQWAHFRWNDSKGLFCDQFVVAQSRIRGHQICDIGVEDKINPITAYRLFCAYIRGMGLKPITWTIDDKPPDGI